MNHVGRAVSRVTPTPFFHHNIQGNLWLQITVNVARHAPPSFSLVIPASPLQHHSRHCPPPPVPRVPVLKRMFPRALCCSTVGDGVADSPALQGSAWARCRRHGASPHPRRGSLALADWLASHQQRQQRGVRLWVSRAAAGGRYVRVPVPREQPVWVFRCPNNKPQRNA